MRIIPAIDIIEGKCVRLSQGDYNQKKIYSESPLEVAKSFEGAGIKHLHLVDLDGAKSRCIVNTDVLESICNNTDLAVDFGGGIKSDQDINIAFNCGAKQVTAGSVAVEQPDVVEQWLKDFGEDKIILGADVRGELVSINGWKDNTTVNVFDLLQRFESLGAKSVISTDIATDGMLSGPSFELYTAMMKKFPAMNIIASGGVASTKDLDQLKELGLSAVIIGKAIYENMITLKQLSSYVD